MNQDAGKARPSFLAAFLTAVQFLLISPAFIRRPFTAAELGAAVGFYPLVGLILGAILFGADALFGLFLPHQVRAALVLGLWVSLTGALHLDGFLDACDGLLGGHTPEQRMEIMRDERVGAYALAGGALLLLLKFSALASIQMRLPALLLAPVLGRWGMAVALAAFPYARPQGLGRLVKDNTRRSQVWLASVTTLLIAVGLAFYMPDVRILLCLAAAPIVTILTARFTLARIPGLTGDLYGALNELTEMVILLIFSAF